MWTAPRTKPIRLVMIHTNEGPDGPTSAEGLASYLQTISGGYHIVVDCDSSVRCAPDNVQVAGGPPEVNGDALAVCITGYSYQTDWSSASEQAAIDRMAQLVAEWCKTYSIPARRLSPLELYNGAHGIAGHVDGTNAYRQYGGDTTLDHTDPGPNFPWDEFITKVNGYISPAPPPRPKGHELSFYFTCKNHPPIAGYGDMSIYTFQSNGIEYRPHGSPEDFNLMRYTMALAGIPAPDHPQVGDLDYNKIVKFMKLVVGP